MLNFYVKARTWMEQDEGATALEYAVLVTAIVLALLAGAIIFGDALGDFFANLFPI
jgi:Flp pilus assembly pilin Flp